MENKEISEIEKARKMWILCKSIPISNAWLLEFLDKFFDDNDPGTEIKKEINRLIKMEKEIKKEIGET